MAEVLKTLVFILVLAVGYSAAALIWNSSHS
jgi:hypothetical protein